MDQYWWWWTDILNFDVYVIGFITIKKIPRLNQIIELFVLFSFILCKRGFSLAILQLSSHSDGNRDNVSEMVLSSPILHSTEWRGSKSLLCQQVGVQRSLDLQATISELNGLYRIWVLQALGMVCVNEISTQMSKTIFLCYDLVILDRAYQVAPTSDQMFLSASCVWIIVQTPGLWHPSVLIGQGRCFNGSRCVWTEINAFCIFLRHEVVLPARRALE